MNSNLNDNFFVTDIKNNLSVFNNNNVSPYQINFSGKYLSSFKKNVDSILKSTLIKKKKISINEKKFVIKAINSDINLRYIDYPLSNYKITNSELSNFNNKIFDQILRILLFLIVLQVVYLLFASALLIEVVFLSDLMMLLNYISLVF